MIAAPRDASTVIVCRDSPEGIEVYLLRRSSNSPAVPDAYVFPGGTISNADKSPAARMRLAGQWRPAEPAFTFAALRETFEECGLLYAVEAVDSERLRAARTAMLEGKRSFNETLVGLNVHLDAPAIHYFSRWITPPVVPHRFDARFFVGRCPGGQLAEADAFETYDGRWIRPLEAIAAAERRELQMIFPTLKHLERVAAFPTVDELIAFADTKKTIPVTPDVRDGHAFSLPPALENTW